MSRREDSSSRLRTSGTCSSSLPGLALKGCLFHLKQSWWKKIQKVGLSEEFKNPDSEIGQFFKITFGLPYLDPLDVCESYAFDILEQAPDDQRIDEYLEYLAKTYICSHSSFSPTLWASIDVCSKRTTNGSETFHRKLPGLLHASHPSDFKRPFKNSRPAKLSDRK